MKKFLLPSLFASALIFGQAHTKKLGAFGSVEVNAGFDLADIIRTKNAKNDFERRQLPPGKFNYGVTSLVGFHPLNRLALSGGLRYSYIDPNYHLLYAVVQPELVLGTLEDENFNYLFANFGQKINHTAAADAGLVGLGFGTVESLGKNFGHKLQVYVEDQITAGEANIFVGISYGIILFSNKH